MNQLAWASGLKKSSGKGEKDLGELYRSQQDNFLAHKGA